MGTKGEIQIMIREFVETRTCQMHGEPYEVDGIYVRIILPSGKHKSYIFASGWTLEQIIKSLEGHPTNFKDYSWKQIEWKTRKQFKNQKQIK